MNSAIVYLSLVLSLLFVNLGDEYGSETVRKTSYEIVDEVLNRSAKIYLCFIPLLFWGNLVMQRLSCCI